MKKNQLQNPEKPKPKPKFVFYNRMPRAASSTFYAVIDELSKENKFTSEKISSGELGSNSPANNDQIIQFLKGKPLNKYFLTKTHFWLDFAKYNMTQPIFINLVRGEILEISERLTFPH